MKMRRILYASVLIVFVILYFMYPYWFSWYLLCLVILLVPLDFVMCLFGRLITWHVLLRTPKLLTQGMEGKLIISTTRDKFFPSGPLILRLKISADESTTIKKIKCETSATGQYEMPIDTSQSSFVIYEIESAGATGPLGLFLGKLNLKSRARVLILPNPERPPHAEKLPRDIAKSQEQNDFSDVYDLRDYRQGDLLKNVHWKLSAKFDSLVVREPLETPPQNRLIDVKVWTNPKERDIILSRLLWVSNYLLERDMQFYVKMGVDETISKITQKEDLIDHLYITLDSTESTLQPSVSRSARFTWVFKIDTDN